MEISATCTEIIDLTKEYVTYPSRNPVKKQLNNKLRNLVMQRVNADTITTLLSNLIALRNQHKSQFSLCTEALLHYQSVLILAVNSKNINDLLIALVQDASVTVEVFDTSDVSSANNEIILDILRYEQILCRILQYMTSQLSDAQLLNRLTDLLICIHKRVPLIDCKSTVAMVASLILRNIHRENYIETLHQCLSSDGPSSFPPSSIEQLFVTSLAKSTTSSDHSICGKDRLAFLFGILGIVNESVLISSVVKPSIGILLLYTILEEPDLVESSARVLQARTLSLWFQKIVSTLTPVNLDIESDLHRELAGPMENVIEYVFNNQEDPIDVIKHSARTIFQLAITAHHTMCKCSNAATCQMPCSLLLERISGQSWDQRGKYTLISAIAQVYGPEVVIQALPDILTVLISNCSEHSLATHASDLYMTLLMCRLGLVTGQIPSKCAPVSFDYAFWIDPILDGFESSNDLVRLSMVQYFIPKLSVTFPSGLLYIIDKYNSGRFCNPCVFLACVKGALARNLEFSSSLTESPAHSPDAQLWKGIVPLNVLRKSFISHDDEVRLNAMTLLCEDNKRTRPVDSVNLDLILEFVECNLASLSPTFRQKMTSILETLCTRIIESSACLIKNQQTKKQKPQDDTTLVDYKAFFPRLIKVFLTNLHLGCSFPRRTTILACLSRILCILKTRGSDLVEIGALFTPKDDCNLLQYLADSYATNKGNALSIMFSINTLDRLEKSSIESLGTRAWHMSRSNHPQDCATAVYITRLLLHLSPEAFHSAVVQPILLSCPGGVAAIGDEKMTPRLAMIELLVRFLEEQVVVGKVSLIRVAVYHPFYSMLHCLADLISELDIDLMSPSLLSRILACCYDVGLLVSPVVSHCSPEGHLVPLGPGMDLGAVTSSGNDQKALEQSLSGANDITESSHSNGDIQLPELLATCCWRGIKEAALLLGKISLKTLIRPTPLLTELQVQEMGRFFWTQLLESRHRGAFELASVGFTELCEALWRNRISEYHELPMSWLEKVLEVIKNRGDVNLCSTRRSAGLPYFIQSLIYSEKATNPPILRSLPAVMNLLIEIVTETAILQIEAQENEPLIHALNILRVLYRDANLGEEMSQYISHGLKIAVLGFSAKSWSIRNSSTMLFSSLMQRIFGVSRSKEITSKKNYLSSRVFFSRYEGIYEFLLTQLENEVKNIQSLQPRLYPVLLIFSRLLPPTMEATDTNFTLDSFIPLIQSCGASSVLRVRILSARALTSLVPKNRLEKMTVKLIELLPRSLTPSVKYNAIHGTILQIRHLLDELLLVSSSPPETCLKLLNSLLQSDWLLRITHCDVIKADYVTLLRLLVPHIGSDSVFDQILMRETVWTLVHEQFSRVLDLDAPSELPGYVSLLFELCDLAFALIDTREVTSVPIDLLQSLIASKHVEVRSKVLSYLVDHTKINSNNKLLICLGVSSDFIQQKIVTETSHTCLIDFFKLLVITLEEDDTGVDFVDICRLILVRINDLPHTDLACVGLDLIGLCIGKGVAVLTKRDTIDEASMGVFRAGVARISEACRLNQPDCLRVSAVACLAHIAPLMMSKDNHLGKCVYLLWECWFTGLFDADQDVSSEASKLLSKFDTTASDIMTPWCVYPLAVNCLLTSCSDVTCCSLIGQMGDWILGGMSTEIWTSSQTNCKFRVFDRGELNICADDILFVDTLFGCVKDRLLSKSLNVGRGCCISTLISLSPVTQNLDDLLETQFLICLNDSGKQVDLLVDQYRRQKYTMLREYFASDHATNVI